MVGRYTGKLILKVLFVNADYRFWRADGARFQTSAVAGAEMFGRARMSCCGVNEAIRAVGAKPRKQASPQSIAMPSAIHAVAILTCS